MELKLYGYWRSSASWRIRWALELKKIPYSYFPVNILKDEHRGREHLARAPLGTLPVIEYEPGAYLSQSMAILWWIEENFAAAPFIFGADRTHRYKILELCEIINCDIGPLQTPRVQKAHSEDPQKRIDWAKHFVGHGLHAFCLTAERMAGRFCVGDELSAADLFLIPQLYNARRFGVDLARDFPLLSKIFENALATPECQKAAPEQQCDAVPAMLPA